MKSSISAAAPSAAKTTAAPDRVYKYYDYYKRYINDVNTWVAGYSSVTMWENANHVVGYTSGYDTLQMVSAAALLHPQDTSLNNPTYYLGEMKITPTESYKVTGVHVYGIYYHLPTATYVDTLILSFTYGDANLTPTSNGIFRGGRVSGGHYGSWPVVSTRYDTTALNYARIDASFGTPNPYVVKIPLGPSTFNDTVVGGDLNGAWHKEVSLSSFSGGGITVPAGKQVAMSYSFKSGATTLPMMDTIFYDDGSLKYNMWSPLVMFASTDGAIANRQWAPYDSTNFNQGMYKTLPHDANGWGYIYVPMWAWSTSSGASASAYQHPVVDWNITCATCGNVMPSVSVANTTLVTKVDAYPNPSERVLNVPFTLSAASNVTVTLSNMLGQVVATKDMGNVASGKAVFNTEVLPAGLYTYTVNANGQKSTGRVVVAH